MQIFDFVVLSVILAPHNVLTLHKTHLPIVHLIYVNSNWIDAQKISQEKKGGPSPLRGGWKPNSPRKGGSSECGSI